MQTKETTRMAFTRAELNAMMDALNNYSVQMMNKSETWGNIDAAKDGRKDIYHTIAEILNHLWRRAYGSRKRIEKRSEQ